jgi:hypothetical protein
VGPRINKSVAYKHRWSQHHIYE